MNAAGVNASAEDREDAEIDERDPEVGFFSPWSSWPVLLSAARSLVVLGLAISGWVYEYHRGNFAR